MHALVSRQQNAVVDLRFDIGEIFVAELRVHAADDDRLAVQNIHRVDEADDQMIQTAEQQFFAFRVGIAECEQLRKVGKIFAESGVELREHCVLVDKRFQTAAVTAVTEFAVRVDTGCPISAPLDRLPFKRRWLVMIPTPTPCVARK